MGDHSFFSAAYFVRIPDRKSDSNMALGNCLFSKEENSYHTKLILAYQHLYLKVQVFEMDYRLDRVFLYLKRSDILI